MRSYFYLMLLISLICIDTQIVHAQPSGKKGVITGIVIDEENGEPLDYATVTLYANTDSTIVTGGITNEQGVFKIEAYPGSYYAVIEFISFTSVTIDKINLSKGKAMLDLGSINLAPDVQTLMEVEVRAEKSQLQLALDKKIFNVGKDLANAGGTAAEVLDNVPSVTVDVEGNISLRGSGDVRILLDGKPSGLITADNANSLRQLPANLIDKIEVVTNPSARYEAEGSAGIINIVLRKEKKAGINGSFDFTLGQPDNYGTAINLNYRKNKFNLFTSLGINYRRGPGRSSLYQEIYQNDTTFITEQVGERNRGGLSGNIRIGTDYSINPKNTLTASLTYRRSNDENFNTLEYRDYLFDLSNPIGISERTDDELEDESNLQYAINYQKTFDKKDQVFSINIQYEDELESESSDFQEIYFQPDFSPANIPDLFQRSGNDEGEKSWLFQSDYVHPFGEGEEGRFETGYRGTIRKITNDYLVEELQDGDWFPLENFNNNFLYDEEIHAIYAQMGNKIDRFSYQFGLRAEYSDVLTRLIQTNEINDRSYANLFPSTFFTYDLPGQNAVQVSYSRRIRRPRFWDLNPFFTFSDARNQFGGNPDLDPEFTNSFELGHIKYWDKGSISSAIYYRRTTGEIERIRDLRTITDEDGNIQTITFTMPVNLSVENNYGLEFNFSARPSKIFNFNGEFNFFRSLTNGTFVDSAGESLDLSADTYTWFARLRSEVTIFKDVDVQLRGDYRAPRNTTQGRAKSITSVDLAASKDILDNKGTLTLSVRDLFNSRRRRYINQGEDFYSEGDFQWRVRRISLTLNYRLKQNKKRNGGRRGGGGDYGGEEF